ncbi:hypothetical protein QJS04_geneDACA008151 [Acorus gramineus]|uniref:Zinc-ribbon domain-containing protein n=1 Tax=Acorus gramineus TaxID=55184 RepID=A0AAV9AY47_ACOGR|nr:hypothetical protein QJS04_geneDACA008151 [Acorus gramineus]
MAEGAKVRVVRCPKCEKLLPVLDDFKVYRCGGCDATLQAKKQSSAMDALVEIFDVEKMKSCESSQSCSEEGEDSETDSESVKAEFTSEEKTSPGKLGCLNANLSKKGNVEVLSLKNNNIIENCDVGGDEKYRRPSKAPLQGRNVTNDLNLNMNRSIRQEVGDLGQLEQRDKISVKSKTSWQTLPRQVKESEDSSGLQRNTRVLDPYPDEGPSNRLLYPDYGLRNGERVKNQKLDGLEQDRASLLRKLDELRDQLSRSTELSDKMKERNPVNGGRVTMNPYDGRVHGEQHFYEEPTHSMSQFCMDMQNSYTPIHIQNEPHGFGKPFVASVIRRPPYPINQYDYAYAPYMKVESDRLMPYTHDSFYHQPSCSCMQCANKHWQVPPQVPPTMFSDQRIPYYPNNHALYHVDSHVGSAGTSLQSRRPQPNIKVDSDVGGFRRSHPKRRMFSKQYKHGCRPLAGGAPFIVCSNCFELLPMEKIQRKLLCGGCFQLISFSLEGEKLIVSSSPQSKRATSGIYDKSDKVIRDGFSYHDNISQEFYGDDINSSYNIQSTDDKLVVSSMLTRTETESIMSDSGDIPSSTELPLKAEITSRSSGVPLHEHFGYSFNEVVSKTGMGSRSKRLEPEKIVSINGTFRQASVKDMAMETEMELAADECSDHNSSQKSGEVVQEEDHRRVSKSGDSFFAGLIKKSFRDFSKSIQTLESGKTKVTINGRHLPERLIKKAEKQAGPIDPGDYWYDYRAGFWGVVGHQCLGIIPPFIEEFNHPMPKNCAGGDTCILVNGRELHQKDLHLLVGRGLPPTRDRAYTIEISGRVVDNETGEELDGLGKLAPTIEKVKHGFGMCVPREMV